MWCPQQQFNIFQWSAGSHTDVLSDDKHVLPDPTPPTKGWVSAVQIHPTSLSIAWGGFTDPETAIESYDVCVGSYPGANDLLFCQPRGLALSYIATLDLPGAVTCYVTVICYNGAGQRTPSTATVLTWSAAAPLIYDIRVLQPFDGTWRLFGVWTGRPDEVQARLYVSEPSDAVITAVDWAIGTSPGSDDVAGWRGIGSATILDAKMQTPIVTRISTLALAHATTYYPSVRSINSAGWEQIFEGAPFWTDFTAPVVPIPVRKRSCASCNALP